MILRQQQPDTFHKFVEYFNHYGPNQTVIDAVLACSNPGSLWVDPNHPEQNALLLSRYGFAFGWGESLKGALQRQAKELKKGLTFIPKANAPLSEQPGTPSERIEFFGGNRITSWPASSLPSGLRFVSIQAKNLHQSNWNEILLQTFGSEAAFERSGGGVALTDADGSTFLGEAIIGFVGKKQVEIGTVTHPNFRGKGYSTLACQELIRRLTDQGLSPYWSCSAENLGSIHVAEKLAFEKRSSYTAYKVEA